MISFGTDVVGGKQLGNPGDHETSGLSLSQFCLERGLAKATFFKWRKVLKQQTQCGLPEHQPETQSLPGFLAVPLGSMLTSAATQPPQLTTRTDAEHHVGDAKIPIKLGGVDIRHGPSLLSGLLICGRCGLRMAALYRNNGHSLRYECNQMAVNYAQARCQSLVGRILDEFVTQQVLCALEPAALEISLRVAAEIEAERAQLHRHWQQRLERAHYEVERAARQYHCVEPEHRLVARNLEQQWEDALNTETALKADYERWSGEHPACLSAEQREEIRRLSADIPTLWHAATTTIVDRQAIVR